MQILIPRPDLLLRRATPADLASTPASAVHFDEQGKPTPQAVEAMAAITGGHLMQQLEAAGFVVMRRPAARQHSAG